MSTVQELEIALNNARKQEEKDYLDIRLVEAKKNVNKCFSTHLFQRLPTLGKQITVRKITDAVISQNDVYYEYKEFSFIYNPEQRFKFEINSKSRTKELRPSYYGFSHEISSEIFDTVEREVILHSEGYFDKIRQLFKQDTYITIGDNNDENTRYKWLSKRNSFITLPIEIKDLLSWNSHPFIFKDELLNTEESIEIIKDISNSIKEKAIKWRSENDFARSEKLYKFYLEVKK